MNTAEYILRNTFEPDGFSLEKALGYQSHESMEADPAFKRIKFAMKQYAKQIAKKALEDASEHFDAECNRQVILSVKIITP